MWAESSALEELRPNDGSWIKDQVDRIAQATGADHPR